MAEYTITTYPDDTCALAQHVAEGVDPTTHARFTVSTTLGLGSARITVSVEKDGVTRRESVDLRSVLNDWATSLAKEVADG